MEPDGLDVKQMAGGEGFQARLPSTLAAVDSADTRLIEWMDRSDVDVDRFAVRLVVREALVNAVRHGHRYNEEQSVFFSVRRIPEGLAIRVEDQGPGFDRVARSVGPIQTQGTQGRGLTIIHSYARSVEYNEKGNVLTVIIGRGGTKE